MFAVLPGPERLLYALQDAIEGGPISRRINDGEAVDQATATAEYDLLIEDPAIPFAGQHEPVLPEAAVIDPILAVRFAREIALVARRRQSGIVDKSANQEARIAGLRGGLRAAEAFARLDAL